MVLTESRQDNLHPSHGKGKHMAKFKLEIELGNDQMRNAGHIARALRDVARQMAELNERDDEDLDGQSVFNQAIRDLNGNKIGTFKVIK